MFKGLGTAMITPFDADGAVDYSALEKIVDGQLKGNVDALFVCGTTGEPPTMNAAEREKVIKSVIDQVNGKIPVFVGTGSNDCAHAVELSKHAQEMGADGVLAVTPYYNKCTQDGLYLYYKAINDAIDIPIVAYNVPGRTGVNMKSETVERLTSLKNVKGVKEASGNIAQILETSRRIRGSQINLYSGDDCIAVPIMSVGGSGLISVASNAIPSIMSEMIHAWLDGDHAKALDMQMKYQPFFEAMFLEVNPIPVKTACALLDMCKPYMRLPLTTLTDGNREKLEKIMKDLAIL
ncbi:MAG TPA: 4-hydroxy-tetrahydrodipicolinate synthase [Candidatus Ornithoclostridium faecavium]|nr:4-hydroxy-tetrahydrodipicolinate synthase [Candidatus Ornithoclostridium faecavium]